MKKIFFAGIIALLPFTVNAMTYEQAYKKALKLEKEHRYKEAMLWYKKAAGISPKLTPKEFKSKKTPLVYLGKNSIERYEDDTTNTTLEKVIFSDFDVQPYQTNYLMPFTYDFKSKSGREKKETQFQLSFKKALSQNILGLDETIYLGYTQTSWWQTSKNSAPFRETNYRPEIFLKAPYPYAQTILKSYTLGLIHESNGRDKESSRSWNRLYLSGVFQYKGLFIVPRIWHRFKENKKSDDNSDIHNFLGYGDFNFYYPYKKSLFNLKVRNNLRFKDYNKGSYEFNWSFLLPWGKDIYGYFYYFNGYGESLIDYNKKSEKVGIGFSITR